MCKLDDIVNKYNNTNHGAIKMKRVDVNQRMYIDSSKEINDENLKFKISDIDRISKYENTFAKDYIPSCFSSQKLLEHFTKRNWKNQIEKTLDLKK